MSKDRDKHNAMLRREWMAIWDAHPHGTRDDALAVCDAFIESSRPFYERRDDVREPIQVSLL